MIKFGSQLSYRTLKLRTYLNKTNLAQRADLDSKDLENHVHKSFLEEKKGIIDIPNIMTILQLHQNALQYKIYIKLIYD